jgi:thiol-disulfide isomerase/thioredoxin
MQLVPKSHALTPDFFIMNRYISFLTITLFIFAQFSCSQDNKSVKDSAQQVSVGLAIGNRAPLMTYPDPDGKMISLESLRGKMVLIDFWASWCPPCRRDSPLLVAAYEQYKDKKFREGDGFTIYSISCDQTKEAWVEAIRKDHLVWKNHVSDLKGWEAEATYLYKISAIPSNVLINGEGIIIAKNISAELLPSTLESLTAN